jgi:hypothetical protein
MSVKKNAGISFFVRTFHQKLLPNVGILSKHGRRLFAYCLQAFQQLVKAEHENLEAAYNSQKTDQVSLNMLCEFYENCPKPHRL